MNTHQFAFAPKPTTQRPPRVSSFQEFPKCLHRDDGVQPADVVVHDTEQEAEYVARGYQAPKTASNPDAWRRHVDSAVPVGYRAQEYPKWIDGELVRDQGEEDALRRRQQATPKTAIDDLAARLFGEAYTNDQRRSIEAALAQVVAQARSASTTPAAPDVSGKSEAASSYRARTAAPVAPAAGKVKG